MPLLAPVADKLGIDLIWFGVLLAVNMQTSFMHPPFGFALFYLRSVAPEKPYVDKVTGKVMQPVTTMEIYKGAIPFLVLQLVMVAVLIAFPGLVTGSLDKKVDVDMDAVGAQMRDSLGAPSAGDAATSENLWGNDASGSEAPAGAASEADGAVAPADPASAASAEESSAAPTPGRRPRTTPAADRHLPAAIRARARNPRFHNAAPHIYSPLGTRHAPVERRRGGW